MTFPVIDVQGMVKRLKLKDRAEEQGTNELPSSKSYTFDPVEQAITGEIERIANEQFDQYLEHKKVYIERAEDVNVGTLLIQANAIAKESATEMERETNVGTGYLFAAKREVVETDRELKAFKYRHCLERPAINYGSKALKISMLGLLLAIEAILNGVFLSRGSEFGLIGGVFEAMIIAGINIAVGVSVGRFILPWLAHKSSVKRALATLGAIAYLGAAFGFNLAVAHYRTAMSGDPFEASVVAYQHLVAAPFAIDDLESWGLFVIGFLFSLLSTGDGWWMDDPYPGYGSTMRHNLKALNAYNDLKQDLFADLDGIKYTASSKINQITRSIGGSQAEFNNILARSQALKFAIGEHFDHLEKSANELLSIYRNENRKYRKTPVPTRFNNKTKWKLHRPSVDQAIVTEKSGEGFDTAVAKAIEGIPAQRTILNNTYRKAMKEYARVDQLVENGEKL